MNKSTALGSALAVLLVFSVFSYAKTYIQSQDQKPVVKQQPVLEVAGQIPESSEESAAATESAPIAPEVKPAGPADFVVAPETYSATAYSLRGRTASGRYVTRGLIAADPRILPLGTRVLLEAGPWTGEYVVADTGGAIKGRIVDIWTPSAREAMQFGRRKIKLTVLSFPERRLKSATTTRQRFAKPIATVTAPTRETAAKQEK